MMAKRAGRWIAGAINFIGSDTLYGRHWGAVEHHPFLHFELCYYQAIEFAIAHKLARVEAGAQGEHKLARGYLPVTTHSAHYIADPGAAPGDRRLPRCASAPMWRRAGEELAAAAPFRKDLVEQDDRTERLRRHAHAEPTIPQQHFRQNPARRTALPQGLRGRQGAGVPRHHAARARPHAGAAEGAGPQHARRRARRPRRRRARPRRRSPRPACKVFGADGVTVQQFNEGAGGQVVFHLHLHVIPRKAGVPMKPPASEKEKPEVLVRPRPQAGGGAEERLRAKARTTRRRRETPVSPASTPTNTERRATRNAAKPSAAAPMRTNSGMAASAPGGRQDELRHARRRGSRSPPPAPRR